jgi:hypothetical protein
MCKAISRKINVLKEWARKVAHTQNMRNCCQSASISVAEVTVAGSADGIRN